MHELKRKLRSNKVIDFGAARDGVHESQLGRRIIVDTRGREVLGESLEEGIVTIADLAEA